MRSLYKKKEISLPKDQILGKGFFIQLIKHYYLLLLQRCFLKRKVFNYLKNYKRVFYSSSDSDSSELPEEL